VMLKGMVVGLNGWVVTMVMNMRRRLMILGIISTEPTNII